MVSELYSLIHSLSAVEKKTFILSSKILDGDKDYLGLYEIILNNNYFSINNIKEAFLARYPKKSFQNNVSYLFKLITKTLISIRISQDNWYKEMYGLMVAKLCVERSITDYALKILRETDASANENQNEINSYLSRRFELDILSDLNFKDTDEYSLVAKQMNLRNSINKIKHLHEQYSIYELLKIRTLNDKTFTENSDKKNIQDLILSEIAIISATNKDVFVSQKLHYMFQSFFLTHNNDDNAAIKGFFKLIELFDNNPKKWNNPPYDYLSVLDEILNILSYSGKYHEMLFYINKLNQLIEKDYPKHFENEVKKSIKLYELIMHIGTNQYNLILDNINYYKPSHTLHINNKKDSEIILWNCILYYSLKKWSMVKKLSSTFVIYEHDKQLERVGRLFYIISMYELRDLDLIDYNIRAFKRTYKNLPKLFPIENIIFTLILSDIKSRGNNYKAELYSKIENKLITEESSNSETFKYLLKYFDFTVWVRQQFESSKNNSLKLQP